jgi:hypothetical protein
MYVNKKQFWILEMIKGADLTPAGSGPGKYLAKSKMVIATDAAEGMTISPSDVLDLSNSEVLKIEATGSMRDLAWDRIARIDFEVPTPGPIPILRPAYAASGRRLMPFLAGKKAG